MFEYGGKKTPRITVGGVVWCVRGAILPDSELISYTTALARRIRTFFTKFLSFFFEEKKTPRDSTTCEANLRSAQYIVSYDLPYE